MLLIIDNYDSFTYNLVQYFRELNTEVVVYHNDQITLSQIKKLKPKKIVISPGPCTPNESGISLDVIHTLAKDIPILGVCLGHQAIAQCFGGKIIQAPDIMHGKTSQIFHNNQGVFQNIPSPFQATRYHSLIVDPDSLPDCFHITAWTLQQNNNAADHKQQTIMGIRHKTYPLQGVQFHPESILTEHGHRLLNNFLLNNNSI